MSQQHDKNTNPSKEDKHKKPEEIQQKIEETGKKVDKGRSKSDTDRDVKNKIMGTDKKGPPY